MLAKHHHVDNSHKIEQVDIRSMDIMNETELITNPYEYRKGTTKTLEMKLKHLVVITIIEFLISMSSRKKIQIQESHDLSNHACFVFSISSPSLRPPPLVLFFPLII